MAKPIFSNSAKRYSQEKSPGDGGGALFPEAESVYYKVAVKTTNVWCSFKV